MLRKGHPSHVIATLQQPLPSECFGRPGMVHPKASEGGGDFASNIFHGLDLQKPQKNGTMHPKHLSIKKVTDSMFNCCDAEKKSLKVVLFTFSVVTKDKFELVSFRTPWVLIGDLIVVNMSGLRLGFWRVSMVDIIRCR